MTQETHKEDYVGRLVVITTEWKGVFAGAIHSYDREAREADARNVRMVIRFGTERGLLQLCHSGPTGDTKLSDPAPKAMLHGVTGIFAPSEAALAAWGLGQ